MEGKTFKAFLVRISLEALAWEAVLVIAAWAVRQYWGWPPRLRFDDELFVIGALALVTGSAGMLRNPYGVMNSPIGVYAPSVRITEEEKRLQLLGEFMNQRSFGLCLVGIGLLTILLAVGVWMVNK